MKKLTNEDLQKIEALLRKIDEIKGIYFSVDRTDCGYYFFASFGDRCMVTINIFYDMPDSQKHVNYEVDVDCPSGTIAEYKHKTLCLCSDDNLCSCSSDEFKNLYSFMQERALEQRRERNSNLEELQNLIMKWE
ncbi:MAG: hypothetical protein HQ536_00245 [Parcubacteria group bacterium]|nr:hypothetical protein [Parcubacteria group bacterium]